VSEEDNEKFKGLHPRSDKTFKDLEDLTILTSNKDGIDLLDTIIKNNKCKG